MRIERIRVERFGGLRGLDTGGDPLGELVAVRSANEGGKTSLFHVLTTLLYGFHPASRDAHTYAPWDGGDISLHGVLRLDDGELCEVHRRLLSTPRAQLSRGDLEIDLQNREIPGLEHLPLGLFRHVFALTLAELAGLERESWARVQDRLTGAMGSRDLVPAREAATVLDDEAGRLWRPNRRGNQRIRELEEEIRTLSGRRAEAVERDRAVRGAARELEERRAELQAARAERDRLQEEERRLRRLVPLRRQLVRIAQLEREAGDPRELENLPDSPERALHDLRHRLAGERSRLARVRERASAARTRIAAYEDRTQALLADAAALEELAARLAMAPADDERRRALEDQARELRRSFETDAAGLFHDPAERLDPDGLQGLPTAEIAGRTERLLRARRLRLALEEAAARPETPREPPTVAGPWLAGAVLVLGGVLAWLGVSRGSASLWAAAAAAAAVGALLLVQGQRERTRARQREGRLHGERADRDRRLHEARNHEEAAREGLAEILAGVPVRDEVLEAPPPDLGARVERLQEIEDRRERLRLEAARLSDRHEETVGEAREAAVRHGLDLPEEPSEAAKLLVARVRSAEGARAAAEDAGVHLARADDEAREAATGAADLESRLRELEARIAPLGEGDPDSGARVAAARLRARDTARRLRSELERTEPDLPAVMDQVRRAEEAGEPWTRDEAAVEDAAVRAGDAIRRVESLTSLVEGLAKDVEHASGRETVDQVDGETRALRAEAAGLARERDRKHLIARLLREAERRFREEHEPDVLRRAGNFLAGITGGRYDRILVDAADGGRFHLRGPAVPRSVPVAEPLSTGTREQVYLALRLAIVDHLDAAGERLPLVIDEAFVNWDRERRGRAFDALQRMSRQRQVFVFTCHEEMAAELGRRGARILELTGSDQLDLGLRG